MPQLTNQERTIAELVIITWWFFGFFPCVLYNLPIGNSLSKMLIQTVFILDLCLIVCYILMLKPRKQFGISLFVFSVMYTTLVVMYADSIKDNFLLTLLFSSFLFFVRGKPLFEFSCKSKSN